MIKKKKSQNTHFICLTIVLFPDSPAPKRGQTTQNVVDEFDMEKSINAVYSPDPKHHTLRRRSTLDE